jgi:hypothetical protein
MRPSAALRERAAIGAVIVAAVLAPMTVHWLAGRTLVSFDTLRLFAPQRWLIDGALRELRLPLWNPYSGTGVPLFADAAHGVLHPVSIAAAWLGTGRSMDLLIGAYVACAGLGAALLSRELGTSRTGAALAAVAYGGSGFVMSTVGLLTYLASAATLPFAVAGILRFVRRPAAGSLALGVGCTAALAFTGDAQALPIAGAIALALAWEAGGLRGAGKAVAAGTLGLLVGGVQLVASAAHIARTVRAEGLWEPQPTVWTFEPWRIPELIVPGLAVGDGSDPNVLFQALADPVGLAAAGHPFPFVASVVVGLLPLALAAVGLAGSGRRGRVLGAIGLVLLWVALGPRLGASEVLDHVPVWRSFRYPEKLVGPLTLVISALAGAGLDASVAGRAAGRRLVVAALALGLAAMGAFRMVAAGLPSEAAAEANARLGAGALHVAVAAAGAVAWSLASGRLSARTSAVVLAALAWIGSVAATPYALRPGDPEARLRAPGPALAAPAPGPRIATPATFARRPHVPGADPIDEFARDFAAAAQPATNVRARLDSLEEYSAMAPARLTLVHQFFEGRWPVVARRFSATHVALDPALRWSQPQLYADATRGAVRVDAGRGEDEVFAVPHRPWASFAPEVRVVPDWRAAAIALAGLEAAGSDAVVVEASSALPGGAGQVLAMERGLESLRVEAAAPAEGTLVIGDAWWPGWEATLDGVAVPIFPADVLVRAVRWPAGRHVLEMRYRPPEVARGLWLSLAGLLTTAAGMMALRRRGEREPHVPAGPVAGTLDRLP